MALLGKKQPSWANRRSIVQTLDLPHRAGVSGAVAWWAEAICQSRRSSTGWAADRRSNGKRENRWAEARTYDVIHHTAELSSCLRDKLLSIKHNWPSLRHQGVYCCTESPFGGQLDISSMIIYVFLGILNPQKFPLESICPHLQLDWAKQHLREFSMTTHENVSRGSKQYFHKEITKLKIIHSRHRKYEQKWHFIENNWIVKYRGEKWLTSSELQILLLPSSKTLYCIVNEYLIFTISEVKWVHWNLPHHAGWESLR